MRFVDFVLFDLDVLRALGEASRARLGEVAETHCRCAIRQANHRLVLVYETQEKIIFQLLKHTMIQTCMIVIYCFNCSTIIPAFFNKFIPSSFLYNSSYTTLTISDCMINFEHSMQGDAVVYNVDPLLD
jgi:hypothetical protein